MDMLFPTKLRRTHWALMSITSWPHALLIFLNSWRSYQHFWMGEICRTCSHLFTKWQSWDLSLLGISHLEKTNYLYDRRCNYWFLLFVSFFQFSLQEDQPVVIKRKRGRPRKYPVETAFRASKYLVCFQFTGKKFSKYFLS